jgi:hypothetical protein
VRILSLSVLNLFEGFSFGINLWLKRDELDEVAIANRKDFFLVVGVTTPGAKKNCSFDYSTCSASTNPTAIVNVGNGVKWANQLNHRSRLNLCPFPQSSALTISATNHGEML